MVQPVNPVRSGPVCRASPGQTGAAIRPYDHGWPVPLRAARRGTSEPAVHLVQPSSSLDQVWADTVGQRWLLEGHEPMAPQLTVVIARRPSGEQFVCPVNATDTQACRPRRPVPVAAAVAHGPAPHPATGTPTGLSPPALHLRAILDRPLDSSSITGSRPSRRGGWKTRGRWQHGSPRSAIVVRDPTSCTSVAPGLRAEGNLGAELDTMERFIRGAHQR